MWKQEAANHRVFIIICLYLLNLHTILRHQRIIRGTQVNEPVPIAGLLEQNRRRVERIGNHGWPSVRYQISPRHHPHVPHALKKRLLLHEPRQLHSLLYRRFQIQMNRVLVPRMVQRS